MDLTKLHHAGTGENITGENAVVLAGLIETARGFWDPDQTIEDARRINPEYFNAHLHLISDFFGIDETEREVLAELILPHGVPNRKWTNKVGFVYEVIGKRLYGTDTEGNTDIIPTRFRVTESGILFYHNGEEVVVVEPSGDETSA